MQETGIVRKVDFLGRVVLPIELRRSVGIQANDPLEYFVDGDAIVLRRYQVTEIRDQRIVKELREMLDTLGEKEAIEAIDRALERIQARKDICYDTKY